LQVIPAPRTKIKIGFNTEEIEKILLSIDRSASLGKRNYAMLLLAAYTGLRSVDVLNMKLDDIYWTNNEIVITQRKTGRPLTLPLENNVGNAIAEYILHGRPVSDSPYVFLRCVPPHTNLRIGSAIGSRMVQKYAELAGVKWAADERKGFHSFRRALGAHMLAAEVPLHTISEVLGHANSDSTKPYLSTDFLHLKMCALSLNGIECVREGLM
jgi:integrase